MEKQPINTYFMLKKTTIILLSFVCMLLISQAPFSYGEELVGDRDKDGIVDTMDVCPTIANPSGLFLGIPGCEDQDNDSFEDTFWDDCPGNYGLLSGCQEVLDRKLLAATSTIPTGTFTFPNCDLNISCPCTSVVPMDLLRKGDLFLIQIKDTTHTSLPFEITE